VPHLDIACYHGGLATKFMNTQLIAKFVKGFAFSLIPIVLVTLKQHGCEIDDYRTLGQDLLLALIPAFGHAAWHYVFPDKSLRIR